MPLGQFDRLGHVAFHVEGQMVAASKAAVTHLALERLGARVLAMVPGQLVRPEQGNMWRS